MKAILFDIDNTLLDFKACSHESILEASKKLNIPLPNGFYDMFDEINEQLWKKVEKKELTTSKLFEIRFNTIFLEAGVVANGIEFEAEFRKALDNSHITIPYAKEVLKELKKRFRIYAASNARLNQQINRLSLAGLLVYFDELFVSEEIGYTKPNKEFYQEIFKRTGLRNYDCIAVGDSLSSDIDGAMNSNIPPIWFNPNHYKDPLNRDIIQIGDLRELLKIL